MPLQIKRYNNRKLYNTQARQYISLEQLALLVRQGVEIQVCDHATGDDQTAVTLSQILLEQEKKQSGFLPLPLLTALIQFGGNALETFRWLVLKSTDAEHFVNEEIARRIEALADQDLITPQERDRLQKIMLEVTSPPTNSQSLLERWLNRILDQQGYATKEEYHRLVADLEALDREVERLRRKS
jgi:polyhydroxyalkanoate synthesis repressor PhaR